MEETAADLTVAGEGTGDAEPPALDWIDLAAVAAQLSPAQREVLLLRYENDLSYARWRWRRAARWAP
jgi:DNA-directed RNA polymerase specialized sigma24 family protein